MGYCAYKNWPKESKHTSFSTELIFEGLEVSSLEIKSVGEKLTKYFESLVFYNYFLFGNSKHNFQKYTGETLRVSKTLLLFFKNE